MQLHIRRSVDLHIVIAVAIFGIWLLLVIMSTFLEERGTIDDLSGSVFALDNRDRFADLNPISKFIYTLGDMNCHQISERSLFINENQMPFCARDTGLFIGLFSGAFISLFIAIGIDLRMLALGIVPLIIDGSLQEITEYESDNIIRLITGILAGTAIAIFICDRIALPEKEDIIPESS